MESNQNQQQWKLIVLTIATTVLAIVTLLTAIRLYRTRQQQIAPTAPEKIPAAECGPDNCSGCCDKLGMCHPREEGNLCGRGGIECRPCKPTSTPPEKPTSTPPEKPTSAPPEKPTSAPPEKPTSAPPEKPTSTPPEKPTGTPPEKPTSTPPPECSFHCQNLLAYNSEWEPLENFDNLKIQIICFEVEGITNCPQGIDQAKFRVVGKTDWENGTYYKNSQEAGVSHYYYRWCHDFTNAEPICYEVQAQVCASGDCR